ncbi:MAG: imidazole glycerol phosphate synthase subunit HisH [Alphaproteobacteria bacterium]
MIVIVDYGRGNLFSIAQALRHLRVDYKVSDKPEDLAAADRILFPGVGAFGDAMQGLRQRGLVEPLRTAALAGKPLLGICVGCQLLLTRGEEFGLHDGLNLIPGTVARLPDPRPDDSDAIRIPNVGWRPLKVRPDAPVLGPLGSEQWMYFVHSYAPMVDNPSDILATIAVNGRDIPVAIGRGNIVGVQFHPEKSGPAGLRVLAHFLQADIA